MEGDKEVRGEGCAGRRILEEQRSFKQEGLVDLGCKVQTVTDHEIVTEFCWNGMGLRIKLEWNRVEHDILSLEWNGD